MLFFRCIFILNGHVNCQTYRYWATENPHCMQEYRTQYLEKVYIRPGIKDINIIFKRSINRSSIFGIFTTCCCSQAEMICGYSKIVRLHTMLLCCETILITSSQIGEWVGGDQLNELLWEFLKSSKSKLCQNTPQNINDLKERLRIEISSITPEFLHNVR